mmetsp:Transcript_10838/g.16331  ORF Transcript_10838/g.16331 Transcript_10838/m.16331 type:complete len:99 (-) Transcript_10838:82-378(-)
MYSSVHALSLYIVIRTPPVTPQLNMPDPISPAPPSSIWIQASTAIKPLTLLHTDIPVDAIKSLMEYAIPMAWADNNTTVFLKFILCLCVRTSQWRRIM